MHQIYFFKFKLPYLIRIYKGKFTKSAHNYKASLIYLVLLSPANQSSKNTGENIMLLLTNISKNFDKKYWLYDEILFSEKIFLFYA